MPPNGFLARPLCEICGSERKQTLFSLSYEHPSLREYLRSQYRDRLPLEFISGETFELVKCQECGFVWQLFVPNAEQMSALYENIISAQESFRKKECADFRFYSQYALEMSILASLCKRKPYQIKVLDFGMGWGFWCLMAKAFGFRISGFEASAARKEYAQRNGIPVIAWDSIPNGNYDFINAEQVFEHIRDPLLTLQHLISGLGKNGIVKISVPNGKNINRTLTEKTFWRAIHIIGPLEHISCYSPFALRKLGMQAGLKSIDHRLSGFKPKLTKIGLFLKKRFLVRGTCAYFQRIG